MSISLHAASVETYLQTLPAVAGLIEKAESWCKERDLPDSALTEARLAPDMWPFAKQVMVVAAHSEGTIRALAGGEFGPDLTRLRHPARHHRRSHRLSARSRSGRSQRTGRVRHGLRFRRKANALHGGDLRAVVLAAELLLPRHHGFRHPEEPGAAGGQGRFPRRHADARIRHTKKGPASLRTPDSFGSCRISRRT